MVRKVVQEKGSLVEDYWKIISEWIEKNNPHMLEALNEPATKEELDEFEEAVDQKLPQEFKDFYSIHNGGDDMYGILAGLPWMSLEQAGQVKETWNEIANDEDLLEDLNEEIRSYPPKAVKKLYACEHWVPFAGDQQHYLAIDFDPGPAGKKGQVINTGRDDETHYVIAPSFLDFLKLLSDQFGKGIVDVSAENKNWLTIGDSKEDFTRWVFGLYPDADDDSDDEEDDDDDESGSKRRFEFQEGSSSKFWEIQLSGDSLTTWWGKIGTAGQSKTLDFSSSDEAKKQYEKLIAEKTKKGYEEAD